MGSCFIIYIRILVPIILNCRVLCKSKKCVQSNVPNLAVVGVMCRLRGHFSKSLREREYGVVWKLLIKSKAKPRRNKKPHLSYLSPENFLLGKQNKKNE